MNTQEIANLIRNWVHYDNLATSLGKQAQNARRVRDEFEEKIIQQLTVNKMDNAIIQIQGGRLSIIEEKHQQPLSLTRIEEGLKDYFAKPGAGLDQTANIMRHLKGTRQVDVVRRLKKQLNVPPLPPPPAPNGPLSLT